MYTQTSHIRSTVWIGKICRNIFVTFFSAGSGGDWLLRRFLNWIYISVTLFCWLPKSDTYRLLKIRYDRIYAIGCWPLLWIWEMSIGIPQLSVDFLKHIHSGANVLYISNFVAVFKVCTVLRFVQLEFKSVSHWQW